MAKLSVHLFFCGSGFQGAGLFAVTTEKSGNNLPKADCPAGWGFDKTTEIANGQVGGIAIDAAAAVAHLGIDGFYVFHVKGDLPADDKAIS